MHNLMNNLFSFFSFFGINLVIIVIFCSSSSFALSERMLKANLSQMVRHPSLTTANTAIKVKSLKTNKIIFNHNSTLSLAPASNMKLVTSAAALTLLGPEFRFRTVLYTDGKQNENVIDGNLYLKGFGDPGLTDERLQDMVKQLKYRGIQEISGDVILDDTFFDGKRVGEGWKDYGSASYSARISALSLNHNTVNLWIRPSTSGQPAVVTLDPYSQFFEIVNKTKTIRGKTKLKIQRTLEQNGQNRIYISGSMSSKASPERETINLEKPTMYTGYVFKKLLKKEGLKFQGRLKRGKLPGSGFYPLVISRSKPLNTLVSELNKKSVNMIAEHLFKYMGAVFEGQPGTAKKGAKVILNKFLKDKVKMNTKQLAIIDGSGLSPLNRLTSEALVEILSYMSQHFDVSMDYQASLAIAGVDGTLRKRLNKPETKRMIRAKTGFINGVLALSGYLHTTGDDILVFSILMNDFKNYYEARELQDKMCQKLVQLQ